MCNILCKFHRNPNGKSKRFFNKRIGCVCVFVVLIMDGFSFPYCSFFIATSKKYLLICVRIHSHKLNRPRKFSNRSSSLQKNYQSEFSLFDSICVNCRKYVMRFVKNDNSCRHKSEKYFEYFMYLNRKEWVQIKNSIIFYGKCRTLII